MTECEMNNGSNVAICRNISLQDKGNCFDDKNARVAKTTACIVILLLTIILNFLVIFPVFKYKKMRKTINYFIVNMAVSDILLACLTNAIIVEQMLSGSWNWKIDGTAGRITCKLVNFMATMLLLVSPITLFFMTWERYRGVMATTMRQSMSRAMRNACLTLCWVIPSILYGIELFRVDLRYVKNIAYCDIKASFQFQFIYYLIGLFSIYVLLYFTVFLLGYSTLNHLRKSEQCINVEESCQRQRRRQRIRSAVQMVLCSLCSFILLSTPYHVFMFFDKLHPERTSCKSRINLYFLFRYLISINSALSPCIYFIFIRDFRRFVRGVYSKNERETSKTQNYPLYTKRANSSNNEIQQLH